MYSQANTALSCAPFTCVSSFAFTFTFQRGAPTSPLTGRMGGPRNLWMEVVCGPWYADVDLQYSMLCFLFSVLEMNRIYSLSKRSVSKLADPI